MKLTGEIIGCIAVLINFLIYQQKDRKNLLKTKLLSDFSWGLHYGLLTAFSGMAVCAIGFLRELTFIFTDEKKQSKRLLFLIVFAISSIIISAFTMKDLFGLLPAVASVIAVFSYWQKNTVVTKLLGVPISACMITYDIMRFSIMGIVNETLTLISIAIFFILQTLKNKKNNAL
ncbi:MAG: YgjV family protein [Clostridia bacterium]|nr:YgjV family protein [Clostridia bacterium]